MQRYKELFNKGSGGNNPVNAYDLKSYLTEINLDIIDYEYLDNNFKMYIKVVTENKKEKDKLLKDLYNSFAVLSEEEQNYAKQILIDIEEKKLMITNKNKKLRDYIV